MFIRCSVLILYFLKRIFWSFEMSETKERIETQEDVEKGFMITFEFGLSCSPEAMDHFRQKIIEDGQDKDDEGNKILPEDISEEDIFRKICDSDLRIYADHDGVEVTERVINSIDW